MRLYEWVSAEPREPDIIRKEREGVVSTVMNSRTGKNKDGKYRLFHRIMVAGLAFAVSACAWSDKITVEATTITEIQNQIKQDQKNLDNINDTISSLTEEQDLIEEMIDDLNAEIVNMMTSIGLKEDEIAAKETEIAEKQLDIEQAEKDYNAAKKREEEQYEAMKVRIRFMYENSNVSLLAKVLGSKGLSGLINSAEIIEKVYESDNDMLIAYEATKNEVQALWDQLVLDKQNLESDRVQLENDRAYLQNLKAELDNSLAEKKAESASYEADIAKYKKEAAAAQKKIKQEQQELKKLQKQQKSQTVTNAAVNGTYTDKGYASTIDNASGSDLGKKIAKYACQYIGNPYVYGGTSLTGGADCSGFVYRVYKDFGYTLRRTSYEQRSEGKEVSYDQAQPGDLICYSGHIGVYIGGGKIVHASNARTGIKVSNATYRSILSVRRII